MKVNRNYLKEIDYIMPISYIKIDNPALFGLGVEQLIESEHDRILSGSHPDMPLPVRKSDLITRRNIALKIHEDRIRDLGKDSPQGPQRIRGIAGSGKTRLLCYKAAYMHANHPDWDIALVFQSQSLYDEIEKQVKLALFSVGGTWNRDKLHVLHAWGGKRRAGFYSEVTRTQGVWPLTLDDVPNSFRRDALPYVCHQFLVDYDGKIEHPPYDAVLIDEGQDLVTDQPDLLYKKRQPFYWFAYLALRPIDPVRPSFRRLIWAYDEYQSLNTLRVPTSREIFGDDPANRQMLTGKYPNGVWKSIVLKKCYRTPGPVILAAHAIGMGLFRREGRIAGPTTKAAWHALGYEVQGDFRKVGEAVTLYRPPDNSPNPLTELDGSIPFSFKVFHGRSEEKHYLGREIRQDLDDGLAPEQILVVVLHNQPGTVAETLGREYGIETYIAGSGEMNHYYSLNSGTEKPEKFRTQGAVTITNLARAKGNEDDMVYIVGLDEIARKEGDVSARNRLFVAMTRSRGWTKLSGIGRYPLYDEVQTVENALRRDPGRLTFTLRAPKFPLDATEDDPDGSVQVDLRSFGL